MNIMKNNNYQYKGENIARNTYELESAIKRITIHDGKQIAHLKIIF